nr:cysteine-rich RLK (receptor-like protein kinase) 8 [Tanacetum cinerariifolium]
MPEEDSNSPNHPLYLHPNDHPRLILISKKLTRSDNYSTWKRSMMIALNARNKYKIVTGEYREPNTQSNTKALWERTNDMIISWIMNTISDQISNSLTFVNTTSALWLELNEHYSQLDGHRIYQISNDIVQLKQQNCDVEVYYQKLKGYWDEHDALEAPYMCICPCNCENGKTNGDRDQRKRLIQFLMGLDECYSNLRGQILLMQPLPIVAKAYGMIRQEEKQREGIMPKNLGPRVALSSYSSQNSSRTSNYYQTTSGNNGNRQERRNTFRPGVICSNCNKEGHKKYKARIVAKGLTQKEGIDYHDTFAPVAKMVTVREMIAIAIHNNWYIAQLDVNNAFLHRDLTEESYADTSIFTLQQDNQHISLLVYVDDILITGNNLSLINSIKEQLHQTFSIKDLVPIHYYLGIEFLRNSFGLIMSQRKYALKLIQSAGFLNVKPSNIPFNPLTKLRPKDGDLIEDPSTYRAIVGKLLYLTITRPGIFYAAQALSQFSQASRTTHLKALVKVLRYIKNIPRQGLYFPKNNSLQLKAFCDNDWENCNFTRRSVTGYCIFLGPCLLFWQSKKQNVVFRSSTKTEYRALADTTCELTWLKYLLKDLGVHISSPIPIFCDNASAIALASNTV